MKLTDTKSKIEYELIDKAVFFRKHGILAFGDLHLGYEQMLKEQGIMIPFNQLKQSTGDIMKIINSLKKKKLKINKIVILGDLKHHFNFKKEEKFEIRDFLRFIEDAVGKDNIILIKGNHEKIELDSREYKDYYIQDGIAFAHGDKIFQEILDKKISLIVLGHLHTAVFLKENSGVKKEKYKCFLAGKWKNKEVIILPSFFPMREGTWINEGGQDRENFSIIQKKNLHNFNIYITSKDKTYCFGKLKDLN